MMKLRLLLLHRAVSRWSAAYSSIKAATLRQGHATSLGAGSRSLSACLFARVANFNEEKRSHSSKGAIAVFKCTRCTFTN